MAVTTAYAGTQDNYLISQTSASLSAAIDGTGSMTVASPSDPDTLIGRDGATQYRAWEAFYSFAVSPPAGSRVVAAHARFVYSGTDNTMEWREYDWGASVGAGDWRTAAQLTALPLLAQATSVPVWSGGIAVGGAGLLDATRDGGTVYFVGCTTDQRLKTSTSAFKYLDVLTADYSGTSSDPALIYSTVPECTLLRVIGAQVQLSDGTWAVLDTDGDPTAPVVTLKHVSAAGVASTIATISTGATSSTFGYPDGLQGYALVVDSSDNLYVLGRSGSAGNTLAAQAYTYSGGSWTGQTVRAAAMPTAAGTINQVTAAWHDIGTGGSIVALVGHDYDDPGTGVDVAYAVLDCTHLLTGSGSMLRLSGDAAAVGLVTANQAYVTSNAAGTLMDVVASSSTRGYAVSVYLSSGTPPGALGTTCYVWAARYIPSSGGTALTVHGTYRASPRVYVDAEAKSRVVAVDDTRMLVVTAHPSNGITVEDVQNIGTSSTFSQVGITYLDGETASMPTAAALASSSLWDVAYDSTGNQLYLYYFDAADGRRLIRTSVDLSTHLAAGDETEIDAAVGASGSTNHMLRVSRGDRVNDSTLISVANETSGGVLATLYVVDAANLPPSAPTLTAKANYDASASGTFEWTFVDPNVDDTQSAFQLQVNSASGASAYDSAKTTSALEYAVVPGSTLTNPGDWQWRVRTWDAADEAGDWSGYATFSTGDTGVVNITAPATDNPDLTAATYTVAWQVTGVTQDAYRVVVVDTTTSATLSDTGWVAGTDTTYQVTGMSSDVQYRVEVTAQAGGVDTNTDTAYLTPAYSSPETPSISVTEYDDAAYLLVAVVNPTPTGDRPEVAYNDILRRVSGSEGAYTVVGTAQTNATFRDYTAASGVTYEFVARAQA
jgi:hypothetical protein